MLSTAMDDLPLCHVVDRIRPYVPLCGAEIATAVACWRAATSGVPAMDRYRPIRSPRVALRGFRVPSPYARYHGFCTHHAPAPHAVAMHCSYETKPQFVAPLFEL